MKKICKNCRYWQNGHEAFYASDLFGICKVLNRNINVLDFSLPVGIVEGCVNVEDRCDTFEYVTGENFGCVHFKKLD
jgi:hypothetical protein